ncbi:hypothetical protein [Serratia sp. FDAARGOS_506]|uniref:hypothetical protein n=1 Tax=Serratia sp. FDAARGOS_506 TaxID=2420306 RepID=UPI000F5076CF|nr:hypothetical protein [Serratia sp. FDAARGOS_506]AYZ32880.1 hypothetical protein EGY12_17975 [Serratia sp. FDAARGOS_506]
MKKLLLLLGLFTGAAQATVIVSYPYAAPRAVVIAPAPIVVAPAPVAVPVAIAPVAQPPALSAGAVVTGAYRHNERQNAYDEINHLQQQRIDELNHLQAQRINNFNSRHPR